MSAKAFSASYYDAVRDACTQAYRAACAMAMEGEAIKVTVATQSKRSAAASSLMWVRLGELASQTEWHGIRMTAEEWKDLLSAGLIKSKVVPNVDGTGFVIVGQRTSSFTIKQMADMITLIEAFGSERDVRFSANTHETGERRGA